MSEFLKGLGIMHPNGTRSLRTPVLMFLVLFFFGLWTHFNVRAIETLTGSYTASTSLTTMVSTLANGVTLLGLAIFHKKVTTLIESPGTLVFSCFLCLLGPLALLVGDELLMAPYLIGTISGGLSGVGSALFLGMIAVLLVQANYFPASVVVAYLAATGGAAFLQNLPYLILCLTVLFVPVILSIFIALTQRQLFRVAKEPGEQSKIEKDDFYSLCPFIGKLAATVCFIYFVNSCMKYACRSIGATTDTAALALITIVFAVLTLISCYSSGRKFNTVSLYRIVFLLSLVSFASVFLFPGFTDISFSLTSVLTAMLRALLFICEFYICQKTGLPTLVIFGIGETVKKIPIVLGQELERNGVLSTIALDPTALCFFLTLSMVVLAALYVLVFTERDLKALTDVDRTLSASEQLERHLYQLADEAGLTDREREVFMLLCTGRSAPHIAKTLYISTSTVNMHVKKIYLKLNVHSKQELLDKTALPR